MLPAGSDTERRFRLGSGCPPPQTGPRSSWKWKRGHLEQESQASARSGKAELGETIWSKPPLPEAAAGVVRRREHASPLGLSWSPQPWVSAESGPWGSDGRALWERCAGRSLAFSGLVEDKNEESGRDKGA